MTDVLNQVFLAANLVIMVAYAAITVAIVVPVLQTGQLRTNKLATATAMIFFSCSLGHGLHAVMALQSATGSPGTAHAGMAGSDTFAMSAAWDIATAAIGVYYWTLRRAYGVLLSAGAIYVDPAGKQVLDAAGARERAARDAAEAHRATLATVVEHSNDAVIGASPEGVITAWNHGAELLFGYQADEVIGRTAEILADGPGSEQQSKVLARLRDGERTISYEGQRLRKDGTPVDVAFSINAITDHAGRTIGVSLIARDVTAARELAERQQAIADRTNQAQRMESLGKLAGGVAHDFNNILAIIANYTDFAIEGCDDKPEVQADLRQVRGATDRATNLTRQLLTFTRGDAIQPQNVDLNIALGEVHTILERTIGEHITLLAQPFPDTVTVHVDPGQLQQILLNLAINARDAMPEGGTIVLEAGTTDLTGDEVDIQPPLPADAYARLLVSDTGHGIPHEVLEHIFEPFYTTKPRGKGTGLGLATVYGIVTEAGGGINVYSEPGIGTTFRIYLPLIVTTGRENTPTTTTRPAEPPGGQDRTVLVVEDEQPLRRVITRILTTGGYHVISAANGLEALDQFHRHGCDILLTDVIMPEMSGTQLARRLLEHRPDLPVVFMSGYSNGLLGTTHILDDDVSFVEKPFTANVLLTKVAEAWFSHAAPTSR
ncbi:hybrid sensor histidine kinase/response regulator [Actinoplanes solisilvae]|uniref:hybrid sensor histidine kinase/response regulator n=1 Tax=Actinoplanes solisilvae TaxID=2486853 RepID=UPI001F0CA123|nr:PAS domain-containing sensor histidine kinase [Actinoplanes solisilvae]